MEVGKTKVNITERQIMGLYGQRKVRDYLKQYQSWESMEEGIR